MCGMNKHRVEFCENPLFVGCVFVLTLRGKEGTEKGRKDNDMGYLRRKIDGTLEAWKSGDKRKPLLLKGARQTGKTESVRHFAAKRYESVVEVNFVERPEFRQIVEGGFSAGEIVRRISMLEPGLRFVPGGTLVFFDEIQEFPEIATSLKFFAQDGRWDVIASGSLLGVHYRRIASHAMGYKTEAEMHSLDFEEFLWALGYGEEFVGDMYGHVAERRPFGTLELGVLRDRFRDYCILGGMPEVVAEYVGKGTFEGTLALQRSLVGGWRDDARKYAGGLDQGRILNVLDHVPAQLAKENRKFQISKVAHGARFRDYRGCVDWLADAGIVLPCHCLLSPSLPLKGNYDPDKFKLYLADTGLLVSMLDDVAQRDLRADRNFGIWGGALHENTVAEALRKSGLDLYYWKRGESPLEEDFFARDERHLVPIEVKASNGRSRSLRTLIDEARYPDIAWGIKLADANVGFENKVLTLPRFCAFLLARLLGTG